MPRILLEVCVDTPAGLAAAIAGGADRIELCSALELGGLTPSPGFMALAAESPVPVFAMIRPRAGDFVFDAGELDAMRRDIDAVRAAGLAGVVLGASRSDDSLDSRSLAILTGHSAGLGKTLHRAIDLVPDFTEALETAVSLGFDRVLSSGGKGTAMEGIEMLVLLSRGAAGRISVMPGSGVNAGNAARILSATGAGEIHASCSSVLDRSGSKAVSMGFGAASARVTDRGNVAALRAALDALT